MMAPPEGVTRARFQVARGLTLFVVLTLGAVLGWALSERLAGDRAGNSTGELVLVDATLPLRSEGAFFPFTLQGPSDVRVSVHLPEMLDGDIAVGPLYAAMRPTLIYETEAREDVRYPVHGCSTEPLTHRFEKPGAYAVRIPPIPTAMGMESKMFVTVEVRARRASR